MSEKRDKIQKVALRSGFIAKIDEKYTCDVVIFEGEEIPKDVIESLEKENYKELKDRYGDPSLGEPIQYDLLVVEDKEGVKEIEVFNRAVLLILHNTEETRRLHRVIYSMEKHKKDTKTV